MERLADRNIPAFIVHGNHDPLNGWGSGFQLPPNVVTFGGHADTEPFIRRGREAARITGISYMRERVTDNLASSLKPDNGAPYSIAVRSEERRVGKEERVEVGACRLTR